MAMETTGVVRTFVRKRLTPSDCEVSGIDSGALKKAKAMAGRFPGTAALRIVADDETGNRRARSSSRNSARCRWIVQRACRSAERGKKEGR